MFFLLEHVRLAWENDFAGRTVGGRCDVARQCPLPTKHRDQVCAWTSQMYFVGMSTLCTANHGDPLDCGSIAPGPQAVTIPRAT